jgi:hypothetical protein
MSKKKIFAIIFALSILISFQVIPAWAQTWPPSPGSLMQDAATAAGYSQATNQTTIGEIVGMVIRTILSLLGVIFISYTVYAGFLWMTAAGNDEKIDQAKKILRNGVIGLIIILCQRQFTISRYRA